MHTDSNFSSASGSASPCGVVFVFGTRSVFAGGFILPFCQSFHCPSPCALFRVHDRNSRHRPKPGTVMKHFYPLIRLTVPFLCTLVRLRKGIARASFLALLL